MQRKHNLKLNYNSMGFDKIEINLVPVYDTDLFCSSQLPFPMVKKNFFRVT